MISRLCTGPAYGPGGARGELQAAPATPVGVAAPAEEQEEHHDDENQGKHARFVPSPWNPQTLTAPRSEDSTDHVDVTAWAGRRGQPGVEGDEGGPQRLSKGDVRGIPPTYCRPQLPQSVQERLVPEALSRPVP